MSSEDVDRVFTAGLGMRYAFCGPFEVIHLNAEGRKKKKTSYYIPSVRAKFDRGLFLWYTG